MRLRFWLLVMDVTGSLHRWIGADWTRWLWVRSIRRASAATNWGEGATLGEEEPW